MIRYDDYRIVPRWFGRTPVEPARTHSRPIIVTALDGEAWLRHAYAWSGDLDDRVRAARRMLFVRFLVDEHRLSDELGEGRS